MPATKRAGSQAEALPDGHGSGSAVTDFRVRKSIKLMAESAGAEIELDAIARESPVFRARISTSLFRTQTGVTPHLYVNTLLMEQALDALVATEASIADIGFDLGFSSQSGFTRFFAANVGMAPTDYRRAAKVLSGLTGAAGARKHTGDQVQAAETDKVATDADCEPPLNPGRTRADMASNVTSYRRTPAGAGRVLAGVRTLSARRRRS